MQTSKSYILCAQFSLLAMSQARAQDIVGAWTHGDTTKEDSSVIVFLADGRFVNIEHASEADAPASYSGVKRGNYTWNHATVALTATTPQDTNGDIGVGRLRSIRGVTFSLSGDTGTLTVPGLGTDTLTRVTGDSPIMGARSYGDGGHAGRCGQWRQLGGRRLTAVRDLFRGGLDHVARYLFMKPSQRSTRLWQ